MQSWRARIEATSGTVLGTAFLIDESRVVTCAHVVKDRSEVQVTFLARHDLDSIPATVDFRGPWTERDPRGDIAVLQLERPVRLQPARFAGTNTLAARRLDRDQGELHVYGFPRGFDKGVDTRVHAPYLDLHADEWAQLEPVGHKGVTLRKGFSGAAVTLADTGEVVGMVVEAGKDTDVGVGNMLPVKVMLDYWRPLENYLPLPQVAAPAAQELRQLLVDLDSSSLGTPAELYRASLLDGLGPAAGNFQTMWGAALFAAEEVVATEPLDAAKDVVTNPLDRFVLTLLKRLRVSRSRTRLWTWLWQHAASRATRTALLKLQHPDPDPDPQDAAVLVRVTPRAERDRFNLIMSVQVGTSPPVRLHYSEEEKKSVQAKVQARLSEAFGIVPRGINPDNLMIRFELPVKWLGMPVEEWCAGKPRGPKGPPIGWAYPVVVRNVDPDVAPDRPRRARERWKELRAQSTTRLNAITCRDRRDRNRLTASLFASKEPAVLVFTCPSTRVASNAVLHAGLTAGVPVMLWSRDPCDGPHDGAQPCAVDGFIEAVTHVLSPVPPTNLPQKVRQLRAQADSGQGRPAYGRALTLFWEDPGYFPPGTDYPLALDY